MVRETLDQLAGWVDRETPVLLVDKGSREIQVQLAGWVVGETQVPLVGKVYREMSVLQVLRACADPREITVKMVHKVPPANKER